MNKEEILIKYLEKLQNDIECYCFIMGFCTFGLIVCVYLLVK